MRDVLRKWTPREKYVKYQNFPTHFSLLFSLECSGEISRKSVESAYPINSLKVDVFLLKSYARFSLVKVPNQLAPHLEIMTPDKTANQWNNRTSYIISVFDNRSRFPGRSIALQHVCYLAQPSFFVFFTQGHFCAFDFSIKVIVKSFHVAILSSTWCKWY